MWFDEQEFVYGVFCHHKVRCNITQRVDTILMANPLEMVFFCVFKENLPYCWKLKGSQILDTI